MTEIYSKIFKNREKSEWVFWLGFAAVFALYIYKIPLDIQGYDEAFYLTVPKRILEGDIFVINEWHGSQFAGFLILPFMALRNLFFDTEGILLHFRWIYLVFHSAMSIIVYMRLRDKKIFGAFAALLLFMFTPYDITALSYNTMGLDFAAVTGVLLATSRTKRVFLISGVTFACAVLCCPHLMFVYAVFSVIVLLAAIIKKNKNILMGFLMFTLGAVFVAAALMLFMFSRTSVSELKTAVPNLFTDPEHITKPFFKGIFNYFKSIVYAFKGGIFYFTAYAISVIAAVIDKNRYKHRIYYIGASAAIAVLMHLDLAPRVQMYYNYIMFPPVLLGLTAYIVTRRRNHKAFAFIYLGALCYTMAIFFSSNQEFFVISSSAAAADIGTVILLRDALCEEKAESEYTFSIFKTIIVILATVQIFSMLAVKINHKYWSYSENSELTETISKGPFKGIKVTPDTNDAYLKKLEALEPIKGKSGSILYATGITWYYLVSRDLTCGSFSAWLSANSPDMPKRLETYYELNPSKIPDYIFVPAEEGISDPNFQTVIIQKYNYRVENTALGGNTVYPQVESKAYRTAFFVRYCLKKGADCYESLCPCRQIRNGKKP